MDESDHAAALRSELVFAPDGAQGEVVALGATLGGSVTSPAVTVTTKPLIVASEISQTEADALILGTQATITGPGLPAPLTGHVDSIGTLTAGADGGLRVPVQVSVDGALSAGAINSLVQVSFDTSASAVEGLLVPLSALHADTDATTTVIVINGDEQTHVAVTVSETGGGVARVQSLGGELRPGDRVVVGST